MARYSTEETVTCMECTATFVLKRDGIPVKLNTHYSVTHDRIGFTCPGCEDVYWYPHHTGEEKYSQHYWKEESG